MLFTISTTLLFLQTSKTIFLPTVIDFSALVKKFVICSYFCIRTIVTLTDNQRSSRTGGNQKIVSEIDFGSIFLCLTTQAQAHDILRIVVQCTITCNSEQLNGFDLYHNVFYHLKDVFYQKSNNIFIFSKYIYLLNMH